MTFSRVTTTRRLAAGGISAAALACTALLSAGAATAEPLASAPAASVTVESSCAIGAVPIVVDNTWVRQGPSVSSPVLYTINSGGAFRITGGPIDNDGIRWWLGHGNGLSDGWTPEANLSCR